MPYENRVQYLAFQESQEEIEEGWDLTFGDRKNEIVFIGQDMEEALIKAELDACLATDKELATLEWKQGYEDEWPVPRAYALP